MSDSGEPEGVIASGTLDPSPTCESKQTITWLAKIEVGG